MRFTKTIASASVAAVLGLGGISVAGATSSGSAKPSTAAATAPAGTKPAAKKPLAEVRRRIRRGAATIVSTTIGITPAELVKELRAGKTIATIATDHGVQPQVVITALETAATTKIQAALTAGKITSARAAKLQARFDRLIPKLVNDWHPKAKAAG